MIKVLLISVILLAIAMAFMAINILIRKNGKFPVYSIGHNKNMHKLGITCVKHDEMKEHRKLREEGCCGCVETCYPGEMEEN